MGVPVNIRLGFQDLIADVIRTEECGLYTGVLVDIIEDAQMLDFWSRFEEAVDGLMLSDVDELQKFMPRLDMTISIDGVVYRAEEADLQIYPSNLAVSFRISG